MVPILVYLSIVGGLSGFGYHVYYASTKMNAISPIRVLGTTILVTTNIAFSWGHLNHLPDQNTTTEETLNQLAKKVVIMDFDTYLENKDDYVQLKDLMESAKSKPKKQQKS